MGTITFTSGGDFDPNSAQQTSVSNGPGQDDIQELDYFNTANGLDLYAFDDTQNTGGFVEDTNGNPVTINSGIEADFRDNRASVYLTGGNRGDLLIGGAGDDQLTGGGGNDTLVGGAGADTLFGGSGSNTASYVTAAASVVASLDSSYVNTGDAAGDVFFGIENLAGSDYDDTLVGDANNNALSGGGGNDTLIGGAGADAFDGGDGTNTVSYATATTGVSASLADRIVPEVTASSGLQTSISAPQDDATGDTFVNIQNLTGSDYDDTLTGDANSNVLSGGGGNDLLIGGGGGDSFDGGDGVNTVSYQGSNGVYVSLDPEGSESGTDTFTNIQNLIGSSNGDVLTGSSGDNVIEGGMGDDLMIGDGGNDTLSYEHSGSAVTVDLHGSASGGDAEGDSFQGFNNLIGSAYDDTLTASSSGSVLDGRSGADTMIGGAGDDTFIVDDAGDTVFENAGAGTDLVQSSVSFTLGANVEDLTLTGNRDLSGTGNALANVVTGNAASNVLDGGTGVDTLKGGTGDDTYIVDDLNDTVIEKAGEGIDLVKSSVSYTLGSNVENLTLIGSAIAATGNDLANVLTGTGDNNILDGGAGADLMIGGAGDDLYTVDNTGDKVIEAGTGGGNDTIYSSVSYSLTGQYVETLSLIYSDNLNINATGNSQVNTLNGNGGNNILNGAAGADTMAGSAGNDTYIVDNIGDVVTEFAGEGTDTVKSSVSYTLSSNVENLTLTGTVGLAGTGNDLDNVMTGTASDDLLNGEGGADRMSGGLGNDQYSVDNVGDKVIEASNGGSDTVRAVVNYSLTGQYVETLQLLGNANLTGTGNSQANTLTGNLGNNVLNGGLGNDVLRGDEGADTFLFNTAVGANNVDTIADFTVGDDMIRLDRSIFSTIAAKGALTSDAFEVGTDATSASTRIIYDPGTGDLFYDADGSGSGQRVQFATLSTNLALTSSSFNVTGNAPPA